MYRMTNYSNQKLCLAFKNQANRELKLAHVPIGSVPAFITTPKASAQYNGLSQVIFQPTATYDRVNSNLVEQSSDGEANDSM